MVADTVVPIRGPVRHRRARADTCLRDRQPFAPAYVGLPRIYSRYRRMRMDMLGTAKRDHMDTYCRSHTCNSGNKHGRHTTANCHILREVAKHCRAGEKILSFFLAKNLVGNEKSRNFASQKQNGLPCERPKSAEVDAKF